MSPRIRLYIAISLDGFIADRQGGVDWLHAFDGPDLGFQDFLAGIGSIITGRRTYEQARSFGGWPHGDRRVVVLTHRALEGDIPPGVEPSDAEPVALAQRLKDETTGDIWLLGGAAVAQAFLECDLVDRIELYVVPLLLGEGIRLFAPGPRRQALRLVEQQRFQTGIVALIYDRGP